MADPQRYYTQDSTEWLTHNMARNYPIVDSTIPQDGLSGNILPQSFLTGLTLVTPPTADPDMGDRFYISAVYADGDTLAVVISYQSSSSSSFICGRVSGIPRNLSDDVGSPSHMFDILPAYESIPDDYYMLRGLGGTLSIGICSDTTGTYQLELEAGQIDKLCIVVNTGNLTEIAVQMSNGDVKRYYNIFGIKPGAGVEFNISNDIIDGEEVPVLTIYRKPLANEKDIPTQISDAVNAIRAEFGTPIMTINNIKPTSNGNFNIHGGDCLNISPGDGFLSISNPCGRPCCGTAENTTIEMALTRLEEAKATLVQYYEALSASLMDIQGRMATLIASSQTQNGGTNA